jgi:hypothetical protein
MNEMQTASLITILSAMPGFFLGLAMLMGRWKPASLAKASDPDRARIATGLYCVILSTMIILLGTGLFVLPGKMGPEAALIIVVVSLLGLIPLFKATQA